MSRGGSGSSGPSQSAESPLQWNCYLVVTLINKGKAGFKSRVWEYFGSLKNRQSGNVFDDGFVYCKVCVEEVHSLKYIQGWKKLLNIKLNIQPQPEPEVRASTGSTHRLRLISKYTSTVQENAQDERNRRTLREEITEYFKVAKASPMSPDLLKWWAVHESKFPTVAKMARWPSQSLPPQLHQNQLSRSVASSSRQREAGWLLSKQPRMCSSTITTTSYRSTS